MLDFLKYFKKTDDKELKDSNHIESFSVPLNNNGSIDVETTDDFGRDYMTQTFYQVGADQPETNIVDNYRAIEMYPEVNNAISEIVSDAIVYEDQKEVAYLNLDMTDFSDKIKNKINDELAVVLNLLDFSNEGSNIFRRWYVDSRMFYHKIIDPNNPSKGIQELRLLDPRSVEFVREIITTVEGGVKIVKGVKEYFLFTPKESDPILGNYSINSSNKLIVPNSAISYAHSGLKGPCGKKIIGYLQWAIKPANQLRMLEDAMVIYRITRAPERRVFYVDVGTQPPKKAAQSVNAVMQSVKNRLVYDPGTGKVKNSYNNMSMTEDYFLMRRDGNAKTEVQSLPGAQNLGETGDIEWINKKLYESLQIPLSRIPNASGGVVFSAGAEITRDELKFSDLIDTLQKRFGPIILNPLMTNLVMKKIITQEEWDNNENAIKLIFNKNSYFEEMKELEIIERRATAVSSLQEITGKYISHDYIMKSVLKMSEEEIKAQEKLITAELSVPRFKPIEDEEY